MRMTGNWTLEVGGDDRYVRVRVDLSDGSCLSYVDIRRFGTLEVFLNRDAEAFLGSRLGPEPLGKTFTSDFLSAALQKRTAAIKSVLLDQKVVAGMGNIYADEVLFRSRLHPSTPAYAVRHDEVRALEMAIRKTLKCSILQQAKADFASIGMPGKYGEGRRKLAVYGRMGQPCIVCGTTISKDQIAGRGTCFCRKCQAVGRSRGRRRQAK
jgi:formamidopyrimidine-DNA glycosylase